VSGVLVAPTRAAELRHLLDSRPYSTAELTAHWKSSRQAVQKHIAELNTALAGEHLRVADVGHGHGGKWALVAMTRHCSEPGCTTVIATDSRIGLCRRHLPRTVVDVWILALERDCGEHIEAAQAEALFCDERYAAVGS
jgi:hypothetical protein